MNLRGNCLLLTGRALQRRSGSVEFGFAAHLEPLLWLAFQTWVKEQYFLGGILHDSLRIIRFYDAHSKEKAAYCGQIERERKEA